MRKHGPLLLCLMLLLTACGPRQTVKPEVVKVNVKVFVPLDPRLTAPVVIPYAPARQLRNEDTAALLDAREAELRAADARFAEIRRLQPKR